MLTRSGGDLSNDVADTLDARNNFPHRFAGLRDQGGARLDAGDAGANEGLDLLGCLGAALGEQAHLAGHHGEAAALFTGARGLNGRIQGQDVGLEGNAVDGANDVADAPAAGVDLLHGAHHLRHHAASLGGCCSR